WLYLVTLRIDENIHTWMLSHPIDYSHQKRVRQSLVRTKPSLRMTGSAGLCRPRFSFFTIQLSKN
ncbi:hypothetical protein, partial [Aquamicrobium soli]